MRTTFHLLNPTMAIGPTRGSFSALRLARSCFLSEKIYGWNNKLDTLAIWNMDT